MLLLNNFGDFHLFTFKFISEFLFTDKEFFSVVVLLGFESRIRLFQKSRL